MIVGDGKQDGPGLVIDLDEFAPCGLGPEKVLFSETGAFIVEVPAGIERDVLALCARNRVKLFRVGALSAAPGLEVISGGSRLAAWEYATLREAFMNGCRDIFGAGKGD
jgi:hypothetical protein